MNTVVEAAGGVVWRPGPQILLVHRPRYDDWSLPKGKLDPGEHQLAAAVREVFEETGVLAVPAVRLAPVRYLTGVPGVEKLVTYWSMRPRDDQDHEPNDEVDEIAWLSLAAARERLTYAHDRAVVGEFAELPPVAGTVVLIRHALAGSSEAWPGPDSERPLDAAGHRDAGRATQLLRLFAPDRVVSAPPKRCRETVAGLGRPVEIDGRFSEDADVDEALAVVREFAAVHPVTVVCSQGGLLRPLIGRLRAETRRPQGSGQEATDPEQVATAKGTGWVVSFAAGATPIAADPVDFRAPRP